MLRTIVTYPDDILRGKAKQIENIDGSVITLAEDMAETMYLSRGIGLAAPQIGVQSCLIVADIGNELIELYNPMIIAAERAFVAQEGCLSVPDIMLEIERAEKVVVEGINREGKKVTLEAEDLLARVLQHEIDHLQGTLIIDHASRIQRQLISGRLKKLHRQRKDKT
ncbi:MAG TPA: peptide deformylase [Thermodesulfobacteriota bacterium]|mgnify:CR=1 FL=1|nr:peptide deformylase [Thermodesulfobacteriota bacterium]HNU70733.1 peptide deformylase [Thermodesulfobacteriota bacterium]HQO76883.1 peptide deformylase [Thermodesulfobacteriota bacterium]